MLIMILNKKLSIVKNLKTLQSLLIHSFSHSFIHVSRPMFRNYKKEADEKKIEDLKLPDVGESVKEQLDDMKEPLEVKDIDISNLAPRKVDFDLKRAINKKLQKLEKKTQKAISELIRERLNKQDDLLEQVNVGAKETQQQNNDDDSD